MKSVSTLKEDATFTSLAASVVKTEQAEGIFIVDVEGTFLDEPKENMSTSVSASTSSPIFSFSCYVHAT